LVGKVQIFSKKINFFHSDCLYRCSDAEFSFIVVNQRLTEDVLPDYEEPLPRYEEVFIRYEESFRNYEALFIHYEAICSRYEDSFCDYEAVFSPRKTSS